MLASETLMQIPKRGRLEAHHKETGEERAVMDIENPQFETYEQRFRKLAEQAECHKGSQPEIASSRYHLCLYGENGMTPEEEFDLLAQLEKKADAGLKCASIETYYWEDLVLYIPET
jgi:hypothetical protein